MSIKTDSLVKIEIPPIKLALADLAFLKGISSDGVRCFAPRKVTDKLVFLGLIVMGEIPPCPVELKKYNEERPVLIASAKDALAKQDWRKLYDAAHDLRHDRKPEPRKDFVLTQAGKELLRRGETKTQTAKTNGCL